MDCFYKVFWSVVEAREDFPGKMGDILGIVQTVGGLFLKIFWILWSVVEAGGIFLGKWEKCCDLSGDLLANAGGEVYLPAIYSATTSYTLQ